MALLVKMLQERNLLKYKGLFEFFCICEDVLYGLNYGLFLRKVLWAPENLYSSCWEGLMFNISIVNLSDLESQWKHLRVSVFHKG